MKKFLKIFAPTPVLFVAFLALGCASQKPVPYSFVEKGGKTASILFAHGNPGAYLVFFEDRALPPAEKNTQWNPVKVPANTALNIVVHVSYEQLGTSNQSLLGALAASAISSNRSVKKDVAFSCPPLEDNKEYKLEFRKGAGFTGKNLLVLTDIGTSKIVHRQEFDSK